MTIWERLNRKLTLMVGRAVLEAVTDSTSMQTVKVTVLDGDTDDEVEHFQPGGLTHVASGGDGVALSVGGQTDHRVVLCISKRSARPTGLLTGETALYSEGGVVIKLTATGNVEISGATSVVTSGNALLGSAAATQAMLMGTMFNTALQTFLTALGALNTALVPVTGVAPGAQATFTAALAAMQAAATASLSTKHKIDA